MDDTFKWVAGISIPIVLFILGFAGRIIYQGRKEREKQTAQKLRIHFEDINRRIILRIVEMSRNLAIIKDRLIFSSITPIMEHYKFEEDESYIGFEVHFPKEENEWRQLNREALTMKGYVDIVAKGANANKETEYPDARRYINDDFFPLQRKFADFAIRLSEKAKDIGQYQIGTVFKYDKKCPICKKF